MLDIITYLLGWTSGLFVGIAVGNYVRNYFKKHAIRKNIETIATMFCRIFPIIKMYQDAWRNTNNSNPSTRSNDRNPACGNQAGSVNVDDILENMFSQVASSSGFASCRPTTSTESTDAKPDAATTDVTVDKTATSSSTNDSVVSQ
jgi:hypothetical protein